MSDHLPTCPKCGDLSAGDDQFCVSCGAPLTELAAARTRARAAWLIRRSTETSIVGEAA